jgi:hypothetical protein
VWKVTRRQPRGHMLTATSAFHWSESSVSPPTWGSGCKTDAAEIRAPWLRLA